jgi:glucose-1-phosphate cytidylyltransferase
MKIYSHYGYNEFIFALGYKGDMIRDYFLNQNALLNDFTLDTHDNSIKFYNNNCDNFKITFVDTGEESLTGERILRVKKYITEDEFMVTYADGVSDIDINKLVAFHRKQSTLGTITGVHPYSKYGLIQVNKKNNLVKCFEQKPQMYDFVSGGFMILDKKAFDYFDKGIMEDGLLKLADKKQLSIYRHEGFWKAMDTYREMEELNSLWVENKPWAVWEKRKK